MALVIKHRVVSDGIAVVELSGDADIYTSPDARDYVNELIISGYARVAIDMRGLSFMDSAFLGIIVELFRRARRKGGTVVLIGHEYAKKYIRIVGIGRIFYTYDSVDKAVDHLSADWLPEFPAPDPEHKNPQSGWHWFQARIYTSDEDAGQAVEDGLNSILDAFGMEAVFRFPPQRGSWFRELLLRMKDSTARPTRDEFLDLLQRAIEQQAVDKPQAQIDITQSQAVATLLVAMDKTPKAIVQVGSLLVIKVMDTVYVRNLTQRELLHWERNPELFRDPERALQELQHAENEENVS